MKKVNMLVLGVQRRFGNAKEGGKPYDMCMLITGKSVEPRVDKNSTVEGAGFYASELDASPEIIEQVKDAKFPAMFEVSIDVVERYGKFYPRVVGCRSGVKPPATANA